MKSLSKTYCENFAFTLKTLQLFIATNIMLTSKPVWFCFNKQTDECSVIYENVCNGNKFKCNTQTLISLITISLTYLQIQK